LVQGQSALVEVRLEVLRPIQPMLASPAADVAEAMQAGSGVVDTASQFAEDGGAGGLVPWFFDIMPLSGCPESHYPRDRIARIVNWWHG